MITRRVLRSVLCTLAMWAAVSAAFYVIYGALWFPSEINSVGIWLKSSIPTSEAIGFVLVRPAVLLSCIAAAAVIMIYQALAGRLVYAP